MNYKKLSTLLACGALAVSSLLYYSCKKDRIQEKTTSLNAYEPVNTYLDTKKQQEQEFIIDTSGTGPIIGNQGTRIWISKQCLQFPNGDSVSWPFTVKLVELYKPKDMIYYQMPTLSGVNILETGGEIRLRAFKNGTELLLKPGCATAIQMPNAAPHANYMHVFNGTTNGNYPDWVESNPVITFSTDSIGYAAYINKLGWINCDKTANNGTGSTITFTSAVDDLTNVGTFVFIPATKTVMQVYNGTSGLIPNATDVKVVLIGINSSGQLYSYDQSLTINGNTTIDLALNQTTDAALTALLDGL